MHKREPGLPLTVTGGLKNPQGARAIYLGNTIYRIHGTNNDRSVGRANSSGCFRLTNEHVVHLASIAKVGTKVKVLQTYAGGVSETAPLSSLFSFWGSEPAKPAAPSKTARPVVKKATPAVAKTAPAGQREGQGCTLGRGHQGGAVGSGCCSSPTSGVYAAVSVVQLVTLLSPLRLKGRMTISRVVSTPAARPRPSP